MNRLLFVLSLLLLVSACVPQQKQEPVRLSSPESQKEQTSYQTQKENISPDEWISHIRTLSAEAQIQEASTVLHSKTSSPLLQQRATYILATKENINTLSAQQMLARSYESADMNTRAIMEATLQEELNFASRQELQHIASITPRVQENTFPWNVIVWEAASKGLLIDSIGTRNRLLQTVSFADPSLFNISTQVMQDNSSFGGFSGIDSLIINPNPNFHSICLSMVLPLSGTFESIGKQIEAGAKIAKSVIASSGIQVTLNILNSEDPTWVNSLNALPTNCVLVGGPLRSSALAQAVSTGLNNNKAFFAFMPQLPADLIEGNTAWRFFTSPADQINTLLDFTTFELGIQNLATIYPNDSYGDRMHTIFENMAGQRNLATSSMVYSLEEPKTWTKEIGSFLGSVESKKKGELPSLTSSIGAVFLPDGWTNMEMLASIIHYNGGIKLPLLGTSLWEQRLSAIMNIPTNYFELAIFPGAWNVNSFSYGALQLQKALLEQGLKADDWAALGYDFVQMASALGYNQETLSNTLLNQKLSTLQQLAWAAAPFNWNMKGEVKRQLFLFQPDTNGMKLLDKEEYKNKYFQ